MRRVADYDYDRARGMLDWPLVEFLHAVRAALRREALAAYRLELTVWSNLDPHSRKTRPPEAPAILRT